MTFILKGSNSILRNSNIDKLLDRKYGVQEENAAANTLRAQTVAKLAPSQIGLNQASAGLREAQTREVAPNARIDRLLGLSNAGLNLSRARSITDANTRDNYRDQWFRDNSNILGLIAANQLNFPNEQEGTRFGFGFSNVLNPITSLMRGLGGMYDRTK